MTVGGLVFTNVTVKWVGKRTGKDNIERDEFDVERIDWTGRPRTETIGGNGVKLGEKIPVLPVIQTIGVGKDGKPYVFFRKAEK